jgi:L-2-amino-thiazoline-4-carboxylic acid hydrolase-like protein
VVNASISHSLNSFPSKVASDRVSGGMDLRKITTPILTYLLRPDMRFPTLFLIRCKLMVGRLRRRIDPRFPQELIDIATLPLWIYINLKKKLGERRAFEVMRIAILTGGLAQWNFQYGAAETERTFKNLCDAEIEVNKTGFTQWNALEVADRSEHRFEIKITRCLYHVLTISLGLPELTPAICQVDNAAFNSYLPDRVVFNRGGPNHRIADGKKECNFIWEVVD